VADFRHHCSLETTASNNPLNRSDEMKGFSDKLSEAEANRSRLPKSNAADAAHTAQVLL